MVTQLDGCGLATCCCRRSQRWSQRGVQQQLQHGCPGCPPVVTQPVEGQVLVVHQQNVGKRPFREERSETVRTVAVRWNWVTEKILKCMNLNFEVFFLSRNLSKRILLWRKSWRKWGNHVHRDFGSINLYAVSRELTGSLLNRVLFMGIGFRFPQTIHIKYLLPTGSLATA